MRWRLIEKTWCLWPARPKILLEVIGGSYLSASPHTSYRRLFEGLADNNLAIHAWSYLPRLDHQKQANEAWKQFRNSKKKLEERIGLFVPTIRIGHSLGCKLHLLAPDSGRNSHSLVALSFNNFSAKKSIPMFAKLKSKSNLISEFTPNPKETMRIISERYIQPNNLLINFKSDNLDQTPNLIECLKKRDLKDSSIISSLDGDHLTPASFGLRESLLGEWANDKEKRQQIRSLTETINMWVNEAL